MLGPGVAFVLEQRQGLRDIEVRGGPKGGPTRLREGGVEVDGWRGLQVGDPSVGVHWLLDLDLPGPGAHTRESASPLQGQLVQERPTQKKHLIF